MKKCAEQKKVLHEEQICLFIGQSYIEHHILEVYELACGKTLETKYIKDNMKEWMKLIKKSIYIYKK